MFEEDVAWSLEDSWENGLEAELQMEVNANCGGIRERGS